MVFRSRSCNSAALARQHATKLSTYSEMRSSQTLIPISNIQYPMPPQSQTPITIQFNNNKLSIPSNLLCHHSSGSELFCECCSLQRLVRGLLRDVRAALEQHAALGITISTAACRQQAAGQTLHGNADECTNDTINIDTLKRE